MDWLDRLSIAAMAVLAAVSIAMVAEQEMARRKEGNGGDAWAAKEQQRSYAMQQELDKKLFEEVVSYQKQEKHVEALAKLKEIMQAYPTKGQAYVYMARSYANQGQLADSIHSYRRAVELEPDFMDRRTSRYVGDEISSLVEEGRQKLGREKELKPNDLQVRAALEDVYYLQRRLAGGCE